VRVLLALLLLFAQASADDSPRAGFAIPCEVIEWHDGDTGTVRITFDVRVRLIDCWAPEINGRSLTAGEKLLPLIERQLIEKKIAAEKRRGMDSLKSVSQFAPGGSKAVLEIPFDGADRSDDLFTMGRLLGRVWIDGRDVSVMQVNAGHATATKQR
jgi:endonuclease YncB( thermonuclease family)